MAAKPEIDVQAASTLRLPFTFAKRHGVLIQGQRDGRIDVLYRKGVAPASLAEVRRYVGRPINFSSILCAGKRLRSITEHQKIKHSPNLCPGLKGGSRST